MLYVRFNRIAMDEWISKSASLIILHVFKLVHPSLGVALADLPQGLVLITILPHIFLVEPVHLGLLVLIPRQLQVLLQHLCIRHFQ